METDPLFIAVHDNNLPQVKILLKNVNKKSCKGYPLLTYTILLKRVEIFDYLLTIKDLDVDALDINGQSPLFNAFNSFDEYFILELINNGANPHLRDDKGFNLLHLGAWKCTEDTLKVGKVLIDKGVNIDEKNNYGETPIYVACSVGNYPWIHMLTYYNAEVTISSDLGILPVAALIEVESHQDEYNIVREVLFNLTFGAEKTVVPLSTVVHAMKRGTNLIEQILQVSSDISWDFRDVNFFAKNLLMLRAVHFRFFVEKFGHILLDLINHFPVLSSLIEAGAITKNPEQKGILCAMLETPFVFELVQNRDFSCPVIAKLMQMYNEEEEVEELALILLSYGLEVTSFDLDMVYSCRGCSELFKILLHMEVAVAEREKCVMATLYYDLKTDVAVLLDKVLLSPEVFNYFNLEKLKKRCSTGNINKEVAAKVRVLPRMPLLVELSRNVAREFIVKKYNVRKCAEFYTVLNRLPIDKVTRSILALERELY